LKSTATIRKRTMFSGLSSMLLVLLVVGQVSAAEKSWPRRLVHPQGTLVIYQPQVESFKDDKLVARAAFMAVKKGVKQPIFGVVWFQARVMTDRETRMVNIEEVKVTDAKFPDAKPEQVEKLKKFVEEQMALWDKPAISLDRILTQLELVEKEKQGDQGLKNDPPKIFFVTHPAVLVVLDGDPKLRPVKNSTLLRVVNTPFLMVLDPATKAYYLKGGEYWLTAGELKGPWKEVTSLPEAIKTLAAQEDQKPKTPQKGKAQPQKQKKEVAAPDERPQVIVSTEPAELIASDGDPQYAPITGTNLLYMTNTESNVFMDIGTQQIYVLLSGRWFTSKSLTDGPWTFVAADKLPADFAKIPPASPKGFVLNHVAGTQQAQDAMHDMYLPQTAAIDRKKAKTQVKYDGEPKFTKIPNTDLEYVPNTDKAVFRKGNKYYTCDQAVWYEADSPNGPWTPATEVPQDVNKIPPSNPHYNVKYVKVYDSTPETVYVGYTPGYTGAYAQDDTPVYGTGYQYPAWDGQEYIPSPSTYGYNAVYDPYQGSWGYEPPYYNPLGWLGTGLAAFATGAVLGATLDNWWHGRWWGPGGYNYLNINNIHNNIWNRPGPYYRPNYWRPGEAWRPGQPGRPGERPGYKPGERPGGRPGDLRPANRPNIYNRPGTVAATPYLTKANCFFAVVLMADSTQSNRSRRQGQLRR